MLFMMRKINQQTNLEKHLKTRRRNHESSDPRDAYTWAGSILAGTFIRPLSISLLGWAQCQAGVSR
jgi:hypothetical protein